MYKILTIAIIGLSTLFNSCANGQSQEVNTNLTASQFEQKLNELKSAVLIDVRTLGEFAEGHLSSAANYDWNGPDFEKQIEGLDKSNPVMVYCLAGGRSSAAAKKMRSLGFKEVYNLDGGIVKWKNANLPVTTDPSK